MRDLMDIVASKAGATKLAEDELPVRRRSVKTRDRDSLAMPGLGGSLSISDTGALATNADAHAIIGAASNRIAQKQAGRGINLPAVSDEIGDAEAMAHRTRGSRPVAGRAAKTTRGVDAPKQLGREPGTAVALPKTPANLPAVVQTELANLGVNDLSPKWLQIRQLPGYMQSAIRAVGRQVFRQFTNDFPMEDIQTINTLLNGEQDVRRMFEIIAKNGKKLDEVSMDFSNIMPGLVAKILHFSWDGYEWLLMNDMGGYYVYGWPAETKERIAPDADRMPRRLR